MYRNDARGSLFGHGPVDCPSSRRDTDCQLVMRSYYSASETDRPDVIFDRVLYSDKMRSEVDCERRNLRPNKHRDCLSIDSFAGLSVSIIIVQRVWPTYFLISNSVP